MTDPMDSLVNVSAFNLFADKMNEIFEVISFFFNNFNHSCKYYLFSNFYF